MIHHLFHKALLLAFPALLLCGCSATEDDVPSRDSVPVRFSAPAIGSLALESGTRADGASALAEGATLRVAVYRHGEDGALSSGNYFTENTYTVGADGTLQADRQELSLPSGEYSFYAVTPALTVDHSGTAPAVSVPHTADYAVSTVGNIRVSGTSLSVDLGTLERKCAYLGFEAWLIDYFAYVTTVDIKEVTLSDMRRSPETVTGTADFPASGTNDYELAAGGGFFSRKAGDERRSVGGFAVLPKTDGVFSLGMRVSFNGSATPTVFDAKEIQSLSFVKGYRYTFILKLTRGGAIGLDLAVSRWDDVAWDAELGGNPTITVHLGEWTEVTWGTELGGLPTFPVSVGGWSSFDWQAELGGNPEFTVGGSGWNGSQWVESVGSNPEFTVGGSDWNGSQWVESVGGNPEFAVGIPVWTAYEDKPILGE